MLGSLVGLAVWSGLVFGSVGTSEWPLQAELSDSNARMPVGPIGCPIDSPLSCHNSSRVENICCFSHPGGQLLLTQFWDSKPATGPGDSWTLHGLWPDHCDGSFDMYCDSGRKYSNISDILVHFGRSDLVDEMKSIWKDIRGHDEMLWSHEWNKHGTCTNTLNRECYNPSTYTPTSEVVHYFSAAVGLFKTRPSYDILAEAKIVPSFDRTYTLAEIQAGLSAAHDGRAVSIKCHGHDLTEIWYHFDVRGSVSGGIYIPADPDGMKSSCPTTGIRYLPKYTKPSPPTPPLPGPSDPVHEGPIRAWDGRGQLLIDVVSNKGQNGLSGCLIGKAGWFTSGTCATFTAKPQSVDESGSVSSLTLSSRRGPCFVRFDKHEAVEIDTFDLNHVGTLECGHHVKTPTVFIPVHSDRDSNGILGIPVPNDISDSTRQSLSSTSPHQPISTFRARSKPGHAESMPVQIVPPSEPRLTTDEWVVIRWAGARS